MSIFTFIWPIHVTPDTARLQYDMESVRCAQGCSGHAWIAERKMYNVICWEDIQAKDLSYVTHSVW